MSRGEIAAEEVAALKIAVRSLYDAQKLRIEISNRVDADARLGESSTISTEWSERLKQRTANMTRIERELLSDCRLLVKDTDIWPWLESVKGCGVAMGSVLVSELGDPARFDTVSKLWAYCGLHVVDGAAPRRRRGQKANWNGFLRSKLIGVLGPCFLKSRSPYREHYDNEKTRQEARNAMLPEAERITKLHIHNRCVRKMVKMFLLDLYVAWRTVRGLDVRPPYSEEYLGKVHSA